MYCTFLSRNLGTKLKRFKLDADMARAAPKITACLEFTDAVLRQGTPYPRGSCCSSLLWRQVELYDQAGSA